MIILPNSHCLTDTFLFRRLGELGSERAKMNQYLISTEYYHRILDNIQEIYNVWASPQVFKDLDLTLDLFLFDGLGEKSGITQP